MELPDDGFGIRKRADADVVALDGAHEGFPAIPLDGGLSTGILRGSKPRLRAKLRVSWAM